MVTMAYEQVFSDYQALKNHIDTLIHLRMSLYADFEKAVFGFNVFDKKPESDNKEYASREAYVEYVKQRGPEPFKGKTYVWQKFSKELVGERIFVSSVADLLAYEEANKTNELYRFSDKDSISVIDYGEAEKGKSIIVSLTPEAFSSRDFRDSVGFPALPWLQILNICSKPERPEISMLKSSGVSSSTPRSIPEEQKLNFNFRPIPKSGIE